MKRLFFIICTFLLIINIPNLNAFEYWSSDFDTDSEGWQVYLGPENKFDMANYYDDGYICYSRDDDDNVDYNWYLLNLNWEDWSELYGGIISFDIKVSGEGDYKNPGLTVILDLPGPVGTFFYANIPLMPPKGVWTTYKIPILDEVFTIFNPDPVNPLILSHNLQDIRGIDVRGDLLWGDETTCVDNVKIFPPVNEYLLRGRWDVSIAIDNEEIEEVTFFINELELDSETGSYRANGCMKSAGGMAPLSLTASQIDENNFEISCYSTAIPSNGQVPYVIHFVGNVQPNGAAVPDDVANGVAFSDNFEGNWSAIHHDRRRKECPPVQIPPLSSWVDVRAQHNLRGGEVEQIKTILEVQTDIVSLGVLVEKPDGSTVTLSPYTDIFSPDVDFVSNFRYVIPYDEADESDPEVGRLYYFTLLDNFGNPIPGSTKTDIWTGCLISAPNTFSAIVDANKNIALSWESVPTVVGFDPANGIGFYQIEIGGWDPWRPDIYGSNHIMSNSHEIPWSDFVPPSVGSPDGFDLGVGLESFPDGKYVIRVEAFSEPPPGSGGNAHECVVVDFQENIYFEKSSDIITFFTP